MVKCDLVFSDVDGTLLNSEHRITPLTQTAIKTLAAKNIPFVIVSGRGPTGIYPIQDEYHFNCPIISYSGGLILNEKHEVLYNQGFEKSEANDVIDFIEEQKFDLTWCLYSLDQWIVKDKDHPRVVNEEKVIKAQSAQGDIHTIEGDVVNKVLCICHPEKTTDIEAAIKAKFPHYAVVKSSDKLIEIMRGDINKANSIKFFCALLNIDINNTIAFGDNYNDLEMLKVAGQGFLMANAPSPLKLEIEQHTADHNNDGIYQALAKLLIV